MCADEVRPLGARRLARCVAAALGSRPSAELNSANAGRRLPRHAWRQYLHGFIASSYDEWASAARSRPLVVHTEGKLHMFLAIACVSKFTVVEFHEEIGKINAASLRTIVTAVSSYKVHGIKIVVIDFRGIFVKITQNK